MAFIETPRYPDNIGYGSQFKTKWNTSVVETGSGHEVRNRNWSSSRKRYDVAYGVRSQSDLYIVLEFFEVVGGRADGFRFKDWSDFKSVSPLVDVASDDQQFGTGDGAETEFQLTKTYTKGSGTYTRTINKPVSGTVLIEVNGVLQTETTHYTIDYTTGIVTFNSAPTNTHEIKWGGEFDVPVRHDTDELETDIDGYDSGNASIPLVEIRL